MNLLKLKNGESADWKFGIITRYVEKHGKYYYIHDTSDGWSIAKVTKKKLADLLNGKVDLLELNWK